MCLVVVWASLAVWSSLTEASVVHIYVSPSGSDSNTGRSPSHPVKTPQHAVSMLQQDGIKGNDVFVELMRGYYELSSTLHFTHDVTGSVTFRAYQGQEVHVVGGKRIASHNFHHATDHHALNMLPAPSAGKVVEVDLTQEGITQLGDLKHVHIERQAPAPFDVSLSGAPLRLAQWPNEGYVNIKSTPDGKKGKRITYDVTDNRDAKWAQEREPWAYGWWCRGYADDYLPIASVSANNHTMTLGEVGGQGVCVGHYGSLTRSKEGGYFRVINMLSELDSPGEYYVDRTSKKLYLWPHTPGGNLTTSDRVYVTVLADCVTLDHGVQNVHFEDVTLESCLQHGVSAGKVQHVSLNRLQVRNIGSYGIKCDPDCSNVTVMASEIYNTTGGVYVRGGERKTLTSSDIVIRDNHIHQFSRLRGYAADAVHISYSVNVKVVYNHIHHGTYTAIMFSGNDNEMDYNHVHHVCSGASDCGAFHVWGHWDYRGNTIRRNHVHDVLRHVPGHENRGVMLDDQMSSVLAEHNVFYDNECHLNIGGGRDHVVRGNVMYNATLFSIQVDARGLGGRQYDLWLKDLQGMPYKTGIWAQRYPELVNIEKQNASAPEGNVITGNVYWNDHKTFVYCSHNVCTHTDWFNISDNYKASGPSEFTAPRTANFQPASTNLTQWMTTHRLPPPVSLSQTGPQVATGPHYLRAHG